MILSEMRVGCWWVKPMQHYNRKMYYVCKLRCNKLITNVIVINVSNIFVAWKLKAQIIFDQ